MKLNEFLNLLASTTDTTGRGIDAAVTRRVMAKAFDLLRAMPAADAADVIAQGMAKAQSRATSQARRKIEKIEKK